MCRRRGAARRLGARSTHHRAVLPFSVAQLQSCVVVSTREGEAWVVASRPAMAWAEDMGLCFSCWSGGHIGLAPPRRLRQKVCAMTPNMAGTRRRKVFCSARSIFLFLRQSVSTSLVVHFQLGHCQSNDTIRTRQHHDKSLRHPGVNRGFLYRLRGDVKAVEVGLVIQSLEGAREAKHLAG